MTAEEPQEWPTHCPRCGTELEQAVLDFDQDKAPRPELRPGEMAAVDFCPNADCELYRRPVEPRGSGPASGDIAAGGPAAMSQEDHPGSLGGDNGGA